MRYYLLVLFSLFSLKTFAQGSLEGDRLALVALYNATDGPNWFISTGWTVAGPAESSPCGWYGVTCEGNRVTGLDLSRSGLNGNLAPEIGNLNQLKSLILGWSRLSGDDGVYWPMPTELGNLINLEHLDLSGNTGRDYDWRSGGMPIGGPIPASLGNLTKLTYLNLSYLPNDAGFDPFGFLSGSIPPELGNLVNLTYLNISRQSLTGDLPAELGSLTKLITLSLEVNDFNGVIPASFNNFSQIQLLDISFGAGWQRSYEYGLLHGEVPDLSGLPLSAKINLGGNSFTFAGMEQNLSRLQFYGSQAKIPLLTQNGKLYVEAGGTIANNTYKWFKASNQFGVRPVLLATIVGDKYYEPTEFGTYLVEVTNSTATQLMLQSVNYSYTSLPVTLAVFNGINNFKGNLLTWKTTSETDNSGFDIERSIDAKTFEKIGFVDGSGNSKENKAYNFTDQKPFSTTYYRLKQIDYDGKFEYSRIISVKKDLSGINIYPNPAGNQLFVKDLGKEEIVTIRNSAGQTILHQTLLPKQSVNTTHISNGLYTITIGKETRKVVIQK